MSGFCRISAFPGPKWSKIWILIFRANIFETRLKISDFAKFRPQVQSSGVTGGENWEVKKENCKREGWKIEKGRWKSYKWGEDPLFFPFFFFFSLFWKRRKFVLVYQKPKWEFSTRNKHFTLGKKSGKMTLPRLKNMPGTPLVQSGQKFHFEQNFKTRLKISGCCQI